MKMKELDSLQSRVKDHAMEQIRPRRAHNAAVLMALADNGQDEMSVLFEIRNRNIPQGGEICFPGGQIEAGEDPAETACREAAEELLLQRPQIQILCPLVKLPAADGAEIHAYLGAIHGYRRSWSQAEVESVFLIPLGELLEQKPAIYETEMAHVVQEGFPYELIPGGKQYPFKRYRRQMYFYKSKYGVIWGLTAEILYHSLGILRASLAGECGYESL